MYAEEARMKFWNTLRETLKEMGEPFFLLRISNGQL